LKLNQTEWREVVARLIKSEMSLKAVKYQGLSDKLSAIGVVQSADNLRNKINKGILGADLLLQIVFVLNIRRIDSDQLQELVTNIAGEQG
jgi:hypothetical protein